MTLISEQLQDLIDMLFREKVSWPEAIKEIRAASGLDILGAETVALSHEGWKHLCGYKINHDAACQRHAAYHIKTHGEKALIKNSAGRFEIID